MLRKFVGFIKLDVVNGGCLVFSEQVKPLFGRFSDILNMSTDLITNVDAVLFDVGVSSLQFDSPERGFSLSTDGPLDMRMDRLVPFLGSHVSNCDIYIC